MNDLNGIDRRRIDSVCAGDDALAVELVGMLLDEAGPLLAALSAHAERESLEQLCEVAHGLKGIAGNVGAYGLCDAAARLECSCTAGQAPAPGVLATEIAAIASALDLVRVTHRSWAARLASNPGSITS